MRISDWSSDVCSSDLITQVPIVYPAWFSGAVDQGLLDLAESMILATTVAGFTGAVAAIKGHDARSLLPQVETPTLVIAGANDAAVPPEAVRATAALIPGAAFEVVTGAAHQVRSEEHTSELQSLMRISYAVFCLKKKKQTINNESKI